MNRYPYPPDEIEKLEKIVKFCSENKVKIAPAIVKSSAILTSETLAFWGTTSTASIPSILGRFSTGVAARTVMPVLVEELTAVGGATLGIVGESIGFALGAAATVAAIVGPAVLAFGINLEQAADKALEQARLYSKKIDTDIEKLRSKITEIETIKKRIDELWNLTDELVSRFHIVYKRTYADITYYGIEYATGNAEKLMLIGKGLKNILEISVAGNDYDTRVFKIKRETMTIEV